MEYLAIKFACQQRYAQWHWMQNIYMYNIRRVEWELRWLQQVQQVQLEYEPSENWIIEYNAATEDLALRQEALRRHQLLNPFWHSL